MNPPEPPSDDEIDGKPAFPFLKGRRYLIEDFVPFFDGRLPLPNFKAIEHWEALRSSVRHYGRTIEQYDKSNGHGGTYKVSTKAKAGEREGNAIYYLSCGQGGDYTGEGVVVIAAGYQNNAESVVTGTFALCVHEKVEGHGANHSRGWHPGHCKLCGVDMSVDSGD